MIVAGANEIELLLVACYNFGVGSGGRRSLYFAAGGRVFFAYRIISAFSVRIALNSGISVQRDAGITSAISYRLFYRAETVAIEGESYRTKCQIEP
jgi:hypothetical protein